MPEANLVMLRRSFLAGMGLAVGGLALGLVPAEAIAAEGPTPKGSPKPTALPPIPATGFRPNAFVHVAPDGIVTIVCHRSEMGQGIRSSLPVLIADEIGADMAKVKIVQGDGDAGYGDQNTDGSNSIRGLFDDMRKVGATARGMLITAAAKKWSVPPGTCEARDHAVFHAPSKRSLGFGELAEAAAKLPVPKPGEVALRPKAEMKHVGKPLPHLDAPAMVTGKALYGADVVLPGMLTAVIARPPVVGASVAHVDTSKALAIPGVKQVVTLPAPKPPYVFQPLGGVAVIAENTWAAMRGRAALAITWSDSENAGYDSVKFKDTLSASVQAKGKGARSAGDVDKALASAAKKVEAEYHVPHLAHASMEPPAAVVKLDGDKCEVWAPTQNPQSTQEVVAKALGVGQDKVTVHVTFLGGGFGRKSKSDFVAEAALLAKAAKAPVRVQWTREDDVRHDYYHTVSAQKLVAGIDAENKVTAWLHRTAFPSISSTFAPGVKLAGDGELQQGVLDLPLAVPNVRAENGEASAYVRIGWLRSVCNIHHAFAISSFMDEVAHARGVDPRENLLDLFGKARIVGTDELGLQQMPNYGAPMDKHPIDTGRLRGVIERVTEMSGWKDRKKNGRTLGLAAHRSFLSYVAVVASVVRDPNGKIHVDEAWLVADAGTVVNPDRVKSQFDGAFVFGMSIALHGAITLRNGAVEQSNFRDYRVTRINEVPRKIHVELVKSESPPGGVGEPGVPPTAPAIANAVFALTGTRVRDLPLSRAGLVG